MTDNKKPEATFRDGSIKIAIWKNTTEDGKTYTTSRLSNSYKDKHGNWKETDRFSGTELLQLSRLAAEAYAATLRMRAGADNGSN